MSHGCPTSHVPIRPAIRITNLPPLLYVFPSRLLVACNRLASFVRLFDLFLRLLLSFLLPPAWFSALACSASASPKPHSALLQTCPSNYGYGTSSSRQHSPRLESPSPHSHTSLIQYGYSHAPCFLDFPQPAARASATSAHHPQVGIRQRAQTLTSHICGPSPRRNRPSSPEPLFRAILGPCQLSLPASLKLRPLALPFVVPVPLDSRISLCFTSLNLDFSL